MLSVSYLRRAGAFTRPAERSSADLVGYGVNLWRALLAFPDGASGPTWVTHRRTFYESRHVRISADVPLPPTLAWAHPLVAEWFVRKFGTPTEPQEQGWPHILAGRTTLISAPTGSGKTLAAFLACIDRLVRKALAGDLERPHRSSVCVAAESAGERHPEKSRSAPRARFCRWRASADC